MPKIVKFLVTLNIEFHLSLIMFNTQKLKFRVADDLEQTQAPIRYCPSDNFVYIFLRRENYLHLYTVQYIQRKLSFLLM